MRFYTATLGTAELQRNMDQVVKRPRARSAKAQQKIDEARIDRAYRARCNGVQIGVLDIGKVFAAGQKAIAEGVDDAELGNRIAAFVETIRHN